MSQYICLIMFYFIFGQKQTSGKIFLICNFKMIIRVSKRETDVWIKMIMDNLKKIIFSEICRNTFVLHGIKKMFFNPRFVWSYFILDKDNCLAKYSYYAIWYYIRNITYTLVMCMGGFLWQRMQVNGRARR